MERAQVAAGVEFQPGDVLIFKTGFGRWYDDLSPSERADVAPRDKHQACGLEHTEDMARCLWNMRAAALASDCPAVEVFPTDLSEELAPFGFLHRVLIGLFGFALGEFWHLADLAARCAEDGRHTFLLTSVPLHAVGGIGSPANALAIK